MALGLASLPVLYATLELPKLIINRAIDAEMHTTIIFGAQFSQIEHLFVLCGVFLIAILLNGAFKYGLNVYKARWVSACYGVSVLLFFGDGDVVPAVNGAQRSLHCWRKR